MKTIFTLITIFAACYGAFADEPKKRSWDMSHPTLEEIKASYDQIAQVIGAIPRECTVEVFEGLPHPRWEPGLVASESKRGNSFEDHGFLFYTPASLITKADKAALRRSLTTESSYKRFQGFKMCGGYHPDFLVRLTSGNDVVSFQICFGCGEARIFSDTKIMHCDMAGEGITFLTAVLEDYYLERPDKKPVEQGGAGQPATRPESKSEGSDKPQPESEGRSR